MKRHTAGAIGLLWLGLVAAAAAQGTDEAVLLRYRFQPGQEFRYRLTMSGDVSMKISGIKPPPGASVPPRIPMVMTATWDMVQKVKAVSPEGVATVSVGFDRMDSTLKMMDMNFTSRLGEDGKMQMSVNGNPVPASQAPDIALPNPLMDVKVDVTGKMLETSGDMNEKLNQLLGGQNFASMFSGNMPGVSGLLLPAKPVRAGETWETKWSMKLPVPLPGPPGSASPVLKFDYLIQNKLLRIEEGQAVVETRMTASMPPGTRLAGGPAGAPPGMTVSFDMMRQTMTGTQRFQIEEGTVQGSEFEMDMAMLMAMKAPSPLGAPAAAARKPASRKPSGKTARTKAAAKPEKPLARRAPAAGEPVNVKIGADGTMKMTLERLPVTEVSVVP